VEQRLQQMFLTAYGRHPEASEVKRWTALIEVLGGTFEQSGLLQNPEVWRHVAHAMFNTKEFIYYR